MAAPRKSDSGLPRGFFNKEEIFWWIALPIELSLLEDKTMPNTNRDSLILKARDGDERAHERLFEAVAERVHMYIRLRMGAAARFENDSWDILQEAFFAAQQDLKESDIQDLASYVPWLCRIAENRIRRGIVRAQAQKRQPAGKRENFSAVILRVKDQLTGPQTAAIRVERRELIAAAIDEEPADVRVALLGRFFEGRSVEEIATTLGKSPSGVRRLLGEAAMRLGSQLQDLGETS